MGPNYIGLLAGYGTAIAVFWAVFVSVKPNFLKGDSVAINRPWLTLGFFFLGVVGVLAVGQVFMRGMLLPDEGLLFKSLNQFIIFLPALAVLAFQGNFFTKNYLPLNGAIGGVLFGVVLAAIALTSFVAATSGLAAWPGKAAQLAQIEYLPHVVQVLLEDILIAAILVRLVAVTNIAVSIVITAALFAAGHIPAMLSNGVDLSGLSSLALDAGLGVLVIGAIIASRNVWWFWPLHAVMDLTQFFKDAG